MIVGEELKDVVLEGRRRFLGQADPKSQGIREWLSQGTGYFVSTSTSASLVVEAVDSSWADANGADCQRFFWAARDSIVPRSSPSCDPKSIGWSAVLVYYSGLYLMLGLMRNFGSGLLYLGKDDCAAICSSPAVTTLSRGVYELSIKLGSRPEISLEKKNVSGFHEAFWRYADDQLLTLESEMASGAGMFSAFSSQHLQAAILSVEELRAWLGKSGSPGRGIGWMSALRNELNYRLSRRAWSPTYRADGVEIPRLRQDVVAIIRGSSNRLGAQLQIDADVRAMIERVSILFRSMQDVMDVRKAV